MLLVLDCLLVRFILSDRINISSSPNVAISLSNLASLYENQGRYDEAEPLYLDALEMQKQLLGEAHPAFAKSLNGLALLYTFQGRYAEAESLYQQSLMISIQTFGESHSITCTVRGNCLSFLQQVVLAGRTADLSDHPVTQGLLAQLQPS